MAYDAAAQAAAQRTVPRRWTTTYSSGGLVCSVDHLASSAGAWALTAGGSAADAAIAASAVLAVTTPHMCGLGGDLFALVHHRQGAPDALNASGRAGSGADPDRLRADGHLVMPFRGDVRSAPVPGCVDGWCALHERHGRLPLAEVLEPARRLATNGFPASPMLSFMLPTLEGVDGCEELTGIRPKVGARVLRPGVARLLGAIGEDGRDGFYGGEFGTALLAACPEEFTPEDLTRSSADWVDALGAAAFGHDLWTIPPNSQGYLTLASARIAELAGTAAGPVGATSADTDGSAGQGSAVGEPDEAAWPHLLIEATRLAAQDRLAVLHDGADGAALLAEERLLQAAARFDPTHVSGATGPAGGGGTIYLCAVDTDGSGVSLIQSNASGFGCHIAVPGTGVLLHNRGVGFSLEPGHPAEYGPGRRPPHTLAPVVVTRPDGSLRAVLGTMGGDSQPQIVLQMLARLLCAGQEAGRVIEAPRWVLRSLDGSGFDTWSGAAQEVRLEAHSPAAWELGLAERGHRVTTAAFDPAGFGHAHLIDVSDDGMLSGAADPRALTGAAVASV